MSVWRSSGSVWRLEEWRVDLQTHFLDLLTSEWVRKDVK